MNMQTVPALEPFSDIVIEFLNAVSKELLTDSEAKKYPDVVTLAFWMRRASVENLKKRFDKSDKDGLYRLGRGVAFQIAPSNVPVNYAYSLVTGLLCGNANVVRIPSKDFEQVRIINRALNKVLDAGDYVKPMKAEVAAAAESVAPVVDVRAYIVLVQYGHDKNINDELSELADVRAIWGGDATINELRKSELPSRAIEVTFADRYSFAVINADDYLMMENKAAVARDFYNDTYLTDQNACTSPRLVVWMGENISEAKEVFWTELYKVVSALNYDLGGAQAVSKLASAYKLAAIKGDVKKELMPDNLIVRMSISELTADIMDIKDNSGYFFEYDCCRDIMELRDICNDKRCQTLSYIGDKEIFLPLITAGIKGVDRIVPVGKTMDFDLIWDGYNLYEYFTRVVYMG